MYADLVRRPMVWVFLLPLAGLLAGAVAGKGGWLELRRLRHERDALSHDVFTLMRANEGLRRRIVTLRRSERDLERLARQELGLVRDGEIVYRFRSRPGSSSTVQELAP